MPRKSLWVGLLLTALFLWLAFRGVDPARLVEPLRRADYWYILPALATWAAGYAVRTERWRLILADENKAGFARLFGVLVIGFASNNVLPARLGELVRAVLLQRSAGVRASFGLASIFLERVADGLTLLLVLVLLTHFDLIPGAVGGQLDQTELLAATVFLGFSLFAALALWREALAARLVLGLTRLLPDRVAARANSLLRGFLDGLGAMRRPERLAGVTLLSLLVWTLEGASYFALTSAFGLPLGVVQRVLLAATVLVLVNLSIMVPSAPGYVGTFDFVASYALRLFGVPAETALAYAILAHALQYVLVTAAGIAFLASEQLSWGALLGAAQGAPAPERGPLRRPDEESLAL